MNRVRAFLTLASLFGLAIVSAGQESSVTGRVATYDARNPSARSASVVWLTPISALSSEEGAPKPMHAVLRQRNKAFEPHILVVTAGSTVDFPNLDPWFHNVFSLFNGKRFDLGLYEAGTSRAVHFEREGVSYIFCNIHPEMSAVVIVLSSPYFAVAGRDGEFSIAPVPLGRYMLHVWSENSEPATLQALSREVQVGEASHSVGTIRIQLTEVAKSGHKNKYGQDYEPPSPNSPIYAQP